MALKDVRVVSMPGGRNRSLREWLEGQKKDDTVRFCVLKQVDMVMESYKNCRTGQYILTKIRRPTFREQISTFVKRAAIHLEVKTSEQWLKELGQKGLLTDART